MSSRDKFNIMKIGLLIIATNKYDVFIPPLLKSVKKHFMKNHEVTTFVFTDKEMPNKKGLVSLPHIHEPWPNVTLKRYHVFDKHKKELSEMDYLYYCDVDMLFVSDVGDEILPDKNSTAYVPNEYKGCYFAGGFNGGTSKAFLNMSREIKDRVNKDLENNIIAIWHDESQLNRYLIDNQPKVLSPSYCYPESWDLPFEKKILALDKNHKEIRG